MGYYNTIMMPKWKIDGKAASLVEMNRCVSVLIVLLISQGILIFALISPKLSLHWGRVAGNNASQLQTADRKLKSSHVGVAVTVFLGSPRWFQNRYTMMVNNVDSMLPNDWVIQIVYKPNKMALEGAMS